MKVFKVRFEFEEPQKQPLEVQSVEGETLLEIAHDHQIDLHHNCGGVCGCSTCHIYVLQGMEFLPEISDREEDFIDKAINPTIESRLACQCKIGGDIVLKIPDQSMVIGHEH
jgi:2Fe-2S ferredoxin